MRNATPVSSVLTVVGLVVAVCAIIPHPVGATTSPVLYLSFDESSGATCTDHSGFGNHGTMENFATTNITSGNSNRYAGGRINNCLAFDGDNDLVTVADSASLDFTSRFTVGMWINPGPWPGAHGTSYFIEKGPGDSSGGAWSIYMNGDGGPLYVALRKSDDSGMTWKIWNCPIRDRWYYFTLVFDGSTSPSRMDIYADGVMMTSTTLAYSWAIHTNNEPLVIGNYVGDQGVPGMIDEVKLWNTALSQAEIQAEVALAGDLPAPTAETWGNFDAAGVTVRISPASDPEWDSTCTMQYRKQSSTTWIAGHPLTRVDRWRFIGSLFYLDDGATYDVRVVFADPTSKGGGKLDATTVTATVTTRAESSITTPAAPSASIYVSSSGDDSWSGTTPSNPVRTIAHALTHIHSPGTEIVLRGGTYYEGDLTITTSGATGAPVWIHNYPGETAIMDGRVTATLTWVDTGTSSIYQVDTGVTNCHAVYVDGHHLYDTDKWNELGRLVYEYGGTTTTILGRGAAYTGLKFDYTTVSIHLTGNIDPNTTDTVVSGHARAFTINANYIWVSGLTFRYYGRWDTSNESPYSYDKAFNILAGNDLVIRDCHFIGCARCCLLGGRTQRFTFEGNHIQSQYGYDWSWHQMYSSSGYQLTSFRNIGLGRGLVIRRNEFEGSGDGISPTGFSTCPTNSFGLSDETDVYENTIHHCLDDGIECDGNYSNMRIWGNTIHHTMRAISTAPTYFGPVYLIRNVGHDFAGSVWKWQVAYQYPSENPGWWFAYHNTFWNDQNGGEIMVYGSTYSYRGLTSRNNIYYRGNRMRSVYLFTNTDHVLDFDYDDFYDHGGNSETQYLGRYDDPITKVAHYHQNLAELQAESGMMMNGISVDPSFVNISGGDFHLTSGSACINKGVVIPGINDVPTTGYAYEGPAPDIGAFEVSSPKPPTLSAERDYGQYAKGTTNLTTWSAVASAASYYLERSTTQSFSSVQWNSGWIPARTCLVTGLSDGPYYYRVKCRNTYGHESKWSKVTSATQDASAPETNMGSLDPFKATLDFNISTTATDNMGGSGLQWIRLYYRFQWTTATLVQYNGNYSPGPIPFHAQYGDGVYYFYTIGQDKVGNVETTPTAPNAQTTVLTTPPPPSSPPIVATEPDYTKGTSNTIWWTPPVDSVICYVEWSTHTLFATNVHNSGWISVTLPVSQYAATGLLHGRKYYYRVKSCDNPDPDAGSQTDWSNVVRSTQLVRAPYTEATTLPTYRPGRFSIIWTKEPISVGFSFVKLFYRRGPTGAFQQYPPPSGTKYYASPISFDSGPTGGDGIYYFYTRGTDLVGNEEATPSMPDAWTIVDTQPPSAPTLFEPIFSRGKICEISWSKPASGSLGGYRVECATDVAFLNRYIGGCGGWLPATPLAYTSQHLNEGTTYYYRVKARNLAEIEGPWSNIVSATQARGFVQANHWTQYK